MNILEEIKRADHSGTTILAFRTFEGTLGEIPII
jgi:hypothetical protein